MDMMNFWMFKPCVAARQRVDLRIRRILDEMAHNGTSGYALDGSVKKLASWALVLQSSYQWRP